jgi:hypothetical protein
MSWFQNLIGKFSKSPQPMPQSKPVFEILDQDGNLEFRPIVYHFAHTVLPQYFFLEHPNMESVLAQDSPDPDDVLMFNSYFWSRAHAHCAEQGMWHAENTAQFDYLKPFVLGTSFEFLAKPIGEVGWCSCRLTWCLARHRWQRFVSRANSAVISCSRKT